MNVVSHECKEHKWTDDAEDDHVDLFIRTVKELCTYHEKVDAEIKHKGEGILKHCCQCYILPSVPARKLQHQLSSHERCQRCLPSVREREKSYALR